MALLTAVLVVAGVAVAVDERELVVPAGENVGGNGGNKRAWYLSENNNNSRRSVLHVDIKRRCNLIVALKVWW